MIFTEARFLVVFAACWAAFVVAPRALRSPVVAVTGIAFYGWYAGAAALALLGTLVAATLLAAGTVASRLAGVAIVVVLAWFKLAEAGMPAARSLTGVMGLAIPLGLSYASFELLHVIIDRRRGKIRAVAAADLLAFVFFLPCRIAGPIRRLPEFTAAVQRAEPSVDNLYHGVLRILFGLAKKLILADTLALTGAEISYAQTATHAWTIVLAYSLRIFLDFSAYSDIAIGFARLLGISVPENFAYPYLSTNIRDFWNRWHMTLSQWVRDYVFMPVGRRLFGTRLRPHPSAIATLSYLAAFLVVGAWHGLTGAFLAWGAYHGVLLAGHHLLLSLLPAKVAASGWYRSRAFAAASCAFTFLCVTIGWLPFMTDLPTAGRLFALMFLRGVR
jgi:alginate O-acetyltransferase complex protein AlgI